ncbi:MAG: NUDIX domain-containing protein [Candidatus Omnitrophica bacterium]|nr:NUDIX domain-containing protein [Candidatus Omnitrophota bacterium]
MNFIPLKKYAEALEALPILCVDVIIQNSRGEYLLVKRANQPKKNRWWVIGGRVLKGETLERAVIRKVREEAGLQIRQLRPIGYYELTHGVSPFSLPFDNHTVSIIFKATVAKNQLVVLDKQSVAYAYVKKLPFDFKIKLFDADSRYSVIKKSC